MKEFDFIGLKCPIPVLKAFKELKNYPKEKNFQFKCNDPTAPEDFRDLCKNTGLKLIKIEKKDDYIVIIIKRV
ncbi:MAG: hypothetical protein CFH34_00547 [Alphaproteobacteria bacterium MarineAlpha9_Bin4]|nr:hypothetical protein [Pelagibacterales bacterium]PPR27028.1 MAG: hypothetical protein CFH34_00547 [Alphaproteobacteria bacterium MarineAlpha9_Bin4]|tara:strand:- start:66 stop:284 length:219 start_codon:yes stop_codon:yes gene_type:complete